MPQHIRPDSITAFTPSQSKLRRVASGQELSNHQDPKQPRYEASNLLRLKIFLADLEPSFVTGEIIKCLLPFTMSQVLLLRLHCPIHCLKGDYIVKLFDRQYMASPREDYDTHAWSTDVDRRYRQFTFQKGHQAVWTKIEAAANDGEWLEDLDEWDEVRKEANIHHKCNRMYDMELECYRRLKDLQGTDIPRLIGLVELPEYYTSKNTSLSQYTPQAESNSSVVQGLLLQYIPNAFTLQDLYKAKPPPPAPQDSFQYICQDAIRIVNKIMSQGILNKDTNVRNSLIHWDPVLRKYQVMMIDFGLCQMREPGESDRDWRERQSWQDEEGAIGLVMSRNLERIRGGGFVWELSEYAQQLAYDFRGEHGARI